MVVALIFGSRYIDVVITQLFSSHTANGISDKRFWIRTLQIGNGNGQCRIGGPIQLGLVISGYRYFSSVNLLITIGYIEVNFAKVSVGIGKLTGSQSHIGLAEIGSLCHGVAVEGEVSGCVQ